MKSKLLIWSLFFIPLIYLIYKLGFQISFLESFSLAVEDLTDNSFGAFPADPIKFISDITGITALQFFILTLAVTAFRKFTTLNLHKSRRLLGLMSFFYAFNHMFLYLLLDHELSILSLFEDALDKKFIFFGMASFLILLFLSITSTKKLFVRFIKWHQLIYVALLFIGVHYLLSQKVITLTPILYSAALLLLLLFRYKKIKKLLFKTKI